MSFFRRMSEAAQNWPRNHIIDTVACGGKAAHCRALGSESALIGGSWSGFHGDKSCGSLTVRIGLSRNAFGRCLHLTRKMLVLRRSQQARQVIDC
jgi:hypothetical protein